MNNFVKNIKMRKLQYLESDKSDKCMKEKVLPSLGTGSLVGWEGLPYLVESTEFLPGKVTTFEQNIKGSKNS